MDPIKFIRLARKRDLGKDKKNYLAFQAYQAEEMVKEINRRKIPLKSMKVLELAVGLGGYSPVFQKNCKKLIINDIRIPEICRAHPEIEFSRFDVMQKYPFDDNTFDLVFALSLIEHIDKPKAMLSEISRVLKKGGYLYLSFPPFYSPVGGHHFKPFHLLGEKTAVKIKNMLLKTKYKDYSTCFKRDYATYGLHKRTISGVKKMLKQRFIIEDYWARYMLINIAKIPVLGEFITWHVDFLCHKI